MHTGTFFKVAAEERASGWKFALHLCLEWRAHARRRDCSFVFTAVEDRVKTNTNSESESISRT